MLGYPPLTFDSERLPEADRSDFIREEFGRKVLRVEMEMPRDKPSHLRLGIGPSRRCAGIVDCQQFIGQQPWPIHAR